MMYNITVPMLSSSLLDSANDMFMTKCTLKHFQIEMQGFKVLFKVLVYFYRDL